MSASLRNQYCQYQEVEHASVYMMTPVKSNIEDLRVHHPVLGLRDTAAKKDPHLLGWIFREKENHGTFSWNTEDQAFPVARAVFYVP